MNRGTLPVLLAVAALAAGCQSTPDATLEPGGGCVARAEGQCPEGQFCETAPNLCHADDATGTCVDRPGMCTREYRPVCGCDNVTYGNDCERQSAGVALNHLGPCLE